MTTDDVLKSIDELCAECDSVTTDVVLAALSRKDAKASHVLWRLEQLAVRCHQGLSFLRDHIEEESAKKRCFYCGHELVWNSYFSRSDIYDDDRGAVSYYTCPHCGRIYGISDPSKEEREVEYKEYWNHDEDTEHGGGETSQAV